MRWHELEVGHGTARLWHQACRSRRRRVLGVSRRCSVRGWTQGLATSGVVNKQEKQMNKKEPI